MYVCTYKFQMEINSKQLFINMYLYIYKSLCMYFMFVYVYIAVYLRSCVYMLYEN